MNALKSVDNAQRRARDLLSRDKTETFRILSETRLRQDVAASETWPRCWNSRNSRESQEL